MRHGPRWRTFFTARFSFSHAPGLTKGDLEMGVSLASHLPPPPNSRRPEDPRMSGQHHDPQHASHSSHPPAEDETEQNYIQFIDRIEKIARRWGNEEYNDGLWRASDWKDGWLKDVTPIVWRVQTPQQQENALVYLDLDLDLDIDLDIDTGKDFPPDIFDGRFVSLACINKHVRKRSPVRFKPSLHRLHMIGFKFDAPRLRSTWLGRMGVSDPRVSLSRDE